MAKTKISEFSSTAASNTDIDSINIAEGCSPSGINDAIRELMSQLKDWQSGTSNDPYVVGSSGSLTLNQGTANGVAYLNGSKVVTSGSALTFDGTNLGVGGTSAGPRIQARGTINNEALISSIRTDSGIETAIGSDGGLSAGFVRTVSNHSLVFGQNNTEGMRLTSTGLGIGTSSPAYKLDVVGNTRFTGSVYSTSQFQINKAGSDAAWSGANFSLDNGSSGTSERVWALQLSASNNLDYWYYNGTSFVKYATWDSSGNLGLGVTPSAWYSLSKAIEIGAGGAVQARTNDAITFELTSNAYLNTSGNWIYKTTNRASLFNLTNGAYAWNIAASGTAGNAITFTQAMTLDASGNLLVGRTSSDGYRVAALGSTQLLSGYQLTYSGVAAGSVTLTSGGAMAFGLDAATGSTERARIDSGGNLLVGTTSRIAGTNAPIQGYANGGSCILGQQVSSTADNISLWNSATSGNNVFAQFYTETSITARGSITYNRGAGLVAYNTTSDYRAKDIIGPIQNSGTLIDSVPVYMGKMKGATQERPMFIAHETPSYAHTGVKDAVDADGNPVYQQMDASALIPVMWAEIQSLRKRLADAGIPNL